MNGRAFICGLSGPALTSSEADFLAAVRPAGIILFARNVQSPEQVRQLIEAARDAACGPMLVMVDQEGGRVQRLTTPHWPRYPAARAFSRLPEAADTARLCARMMAHDLHALGFNTTAAPVLDVPVPGADNIIGDHSYGEDVETVVTLGGAVAEGLLAGGILPVMKHIPGHGRAMADSHLSLPVVHTPLEELRARFRAVPRAAASAHGDDRACGFHRRGCGRARDGLGKGHRRSHSRLHWLRWPAHVRRSQHARVVRLAGRAHAGSFSAGCDLALHCNGKMEEMAAVAAASPPLAGVALRRFEAALAQLKEPQPFSREQAEAARTEALAASARISANCM